MLYFYPEDFGALGNGVNNDCAAIQSAIDKAEENGWLQDEKTRTHIRGIRPMPVCAGADNGCSQRKTGCSQ